MSTGAVGPVSAPQPEPQSQFSRIVDVFISPRKAFAGLETRAQWWLAFVLIAVTSLAFIGTVDAKIGFDNVSMNQLKQNAKAMDRIDKLSPEQRQRQLDITRTITRVSSYASPVFALVIFIILAAIMMGTFNFGLGANMSFNTSLAVIVLSGIPGILKYLLAIVSMFAGADPEGFNIQNPVATNLGPFVDLTVHPNLYRLASSVDIFMIWTLVLAAIGYSVVTRKKTGTCMAVMFGWHIFFTLIGVGLAALFM
jgi:hypothetical protein